MYSQGVVMGHHGILYDMVAVYGQMALGVMSLFIAFLYKESHNRVMSSDWRKAAFLRRVLFVVMSGFVVLSFIVLTAVVLQNIDSKNSLMSGIGVSTMLVGATTVFFLAANEPCRLRDILDLRVCQLDAARITSIVDNKNAADRSKWQAGCLVVKLFVLRGYRNGKKAWALIMEVVGLSELHLLFPYLDQFADVAAEDMIESSKSPPLHLKAADYPLVSGMVRSYVWKMVCACETSYQELYATIRLLRSRYTNGDAAVLQPQTGIGLLASYSKILDLIDVTFRSLTSKEYLDELKEFQENNMREAEPNEADVVVQWICNSKRLHEELRTWDDAFKMDVQDMLAVCPRSSGYWEVVAKLVKVHDDYDLEALYKQVTWEESLKVVFVLYALNSSYRIRSVDEMTLTRQAFMANCKQNLLKAMADDEELKSGLLEVLSIENARKLADIVMLTFMRVGRRWGTGLEQALIDDNAATTADDLVRDLAETNWKVAHVEETADPEH
jgi:hypothetical protein